MEKKSKQEEWKRRFVEAQAHPNGIKGYCRENGIHNSRFHYWKKKLESRSVVKPAFSRVEVIAKKSENRKLPDPKWLAEFLLALSEGMQ